MSFHELTDRFADTTWLGISMANLALAAFATVAVYVAMTLALRIATRRLTAFAGRTSMRADDAAVEVLGSTSHGLIALAALLVGLGMLDLPERWASRVGQLWFLALALQASLWANRAVSIALRRHTERHSAPGIHTATAAATLVSWGIRTLIWAMVLLAMLSNMGVNITAFVASLGVGGVAVALAAQSVLGDLFASVAIAVDKPFEVGDFITLGSVAGTVEMVGVKTTRIRSLGGEQVVMSNAELLKQTVSNYKRLLERRIVFTFGLASTATPEQAEAVPGIVKGIVERSERLRFDRAHFKGFGESSLDFEVVYIVLDPDYTLYMNEQQRINLELMRALAELGAAFSGPTRTLYMARTDAQPAAGEAPAERVDAAPKAD